MLGEGRSDVHNSEANSVIAEGGAVEIVVVVVVLVAVVVMNREGRRKGRRLPCASSPHYHYRRPSTPATLWLVTLNYFHIWLPIASASEV